MLSFRTGLLALSCTFGFQQQRSESLGEEMGLGTLALGRVLWGFPVCGRVLRSSPEVLAQVSYVFLERVEIIRFSTDSRKDPGTAGENSKVG